MSFFQNQSKFALLALNNVYTKLPDACAPQKFRRQERKFVNIPEM